MPTFVGARRKLRVSKDPSIIFEDRFDGGSLSPAKWTLTDTESKLSVAGGYLLCSGGLATPGWDDPKASSVQTFARVAGLTLDMQQTIDTGSGEAHCGLKGTPYDVNAFNAAFVNASGANGFVYSTGLLGQVPLVTGTPYAFRFILLASIGCLAYIQGGLYGQLGGNKWSIIGYSPAGNASTVKVILNSNNRAMRWSYVKLFKGRVPGPIISVAAPTMPTPTIGADAIVNGAFAADSDWTKGAGWAIVTAAAATAASSDLSQTVEPLSANSWYQLIYTVTAFTAGTITPKFGTTAGVARGSAATFTETGQANSAAFAFTAAGLTASIDNVECKKLTTLFSLVKDAGVKEGLFDCLISTLTAGTQAGDAICLDSETNPLYYLHRYHDGTNFHLDKVENGVPTSLINTAQTWGATKVYRVQIIGTKITCYADTTKIGTTQTVDTTSNYGTKVATFTTLATNAVTNVEVRGGM